LVQSDDFYAPKLVTYASQEMRNWPPHL